MCLAELSPVLFYYLVVRIIMESSSGRLEAEERRQAEIRRQIAKLQAELANPGVVSASDQNGPESPKRKQSDGNILVQRSPEPSKSYPTLQTALTTKLMLYSCI